MGTKSSVNVQTDYALEDIMIGHSFQEMVVSDGDPKRLVSDYSKMSDTEPYPVWYPSRTGVHETEEKIPPRSFGPLETARPAVEFWPTFPGPGPAQSKPVNDGACVCDST